MSSPRTAPTCPKRAARRKTPPTRSTPTSSVIQACSAPLVNVYAKPKKPQSAMISQGAVTNPTAIQAAPVPR